MSDRAIIFEDIEASIPKEMWDACFPFTQEELNARIASHLKRASIPVTGKYRYHSSPDILQARTAHPANARPIPAHAAQWITVRIGMCDPERSMFFSVSGLTSGYIIAVGVASAEPHKLGCPVRFWAPLCKAYDVSVTKDV